MGRISNWKNNKYDPWKEEKYKPWKEEKYKPWKKRAKKKIKKKAHGTGKNVGGFIHSLKEGYNEGNPKDKRLKYKPSDSSVKIGYVENLVLGNQVNYTIKGSPNPNLIPNRQTNELPYHQPNQISNNQLLDIFALFEYIQKLYNEGNVREVIQQCRNLLDSVMKEISSLYNFHYLDIDQFLLSLAQIAPQGKRLILYEEFLIYRNILNKISNQINQFTPEITSSLFSIAKQVIEKIRNQWSKDPYENFEDENPRLTLHSWTNK